MPVSGYCQDGFDNVLCKYAKEDEYGSEILELYYNHRFAYTSKSKIIGENHVKGSWKKKGDTLYLKMDNKPWDISRVTEQYVDSFKNKTIVHIQTTDLNIQQRTISGSLTDSSYGIDSSVTVEGFQVWINNDCNTRELSNKNGNVLYTRQPIQKLSFDCGEYIVRNPNANYFIITLDSFPIDTSPSLQFTKTKWLITATGGLTPINCD